MKLKLWLNLIFINCMIAQAQVPDFLTQKIVFQKTTVTVDEILKELINSKKINLSYAPEIFDLQEKINLKKRTYTYQELLHLICENEGNRIVRKGNQIIIKKGIKNKVILKPENQEEAHKVTMEIIRDLPPPYLLSNQNFIIPPITHRTQMVISISTGDTSGSITEKTKPFQSTLNPVLRAKSKEKPFHLGIGTSFGVNYLDNTSDSLQFLKHTLTPAAKLYLEAGYKFEENWMLWISAGVSRQKYSMQSTLKSWIFSDSLGNDTVKSQQYDILTHTLGTSLKVQYRLKIKKVYLEAGVGPALTWCIQGTTTCKNQYENLVQDISWNTGSFSSVNDSYHYLNRLQVLLSTQIGIQYQKWKIEFQTDIGLNQFSKNESGRSILYAINLAYMLKN